MDVLALSPPDYTGIPRFSSRMPSTWPAEVKGETFLRVSNTASSFPRREMNVNGAFPRRSGISG